MTAPITRQSKMWVVLQAGMTRGEWTTIDHIYSIVEEAVSLKPADFEPSAPGSSDPRWRRNVRNILQNKKGKGEIVWLRGGRYMLPLSADSLQAMSYLPQRRGLSEDDFIKLQERRREIGMEGEMFVVETERRSLVADNMPHLAKMVRRVSTEDIGLGYDIMSFDREGREKFIEVKSTTNTRMCFEITRTELDAAKALGKSYWLYLIRGLGSDQPMVTRIHDPFPKIGTIISIEPSAFTATFELTNGSTEEKLA